METRVAGSNLSLSSFYMLNYVCNYLKLKIILYVDQDEVEVFDFVLFYTRHTSGGAYGSVCDLNSLFTSTYTFSLLVDAVKVTTNTWLSDVRGLCDGEEKEKTERINTMKTNRKRRT
jgi:hypothetical protein